MRRIDLDICLTVNWDYGGRADFTKNLFVSALPPVGTALRLITNSPKACFFEKTPLVVSGLELVECDSPPHCYSATLVPIRGDLLPVGPSEATEVLQKNDWVLEDSHLIFKDEEVEDYLRQSKGGEKL